MSSLLQLGTRCPEAGLVRLVASVNRSNGKETGAESAGSACVLHLPDKEFAF